MALWLVILALIGEVIYVNQVGLPGFVKRPLLEKLRARGLDLQFSRLRWRFDQGIVAENVRFGRADDPLSPQLTSDQVKVSLDHPALSRLKLQVDSLTLRRGRFIWPVTVTNGPPRQIRVDNIQTELQLLPDDQWALNQFTAAFAGAKIQLSGNVTNASAARDWKLFAGKEPLPADTLQNRLRQVADVLEKIHFSATPSLKMDLRGDARDLQSFTIRLGISAPGAETPWGAVSDGRFTVRLLPASADKPSRAELSLTAGNAATDWAITTNLLLSVHLATLQNQTNLMSGELVLTAGSVQTRWGNATNALFSAQWVQALTNPVPLSGEGRLRCESAETRLAEGATARKVEMHARLTTLNPSLTPDESWAWWTNLAHCALDWDCQLTGLNGPKLQAECITADGDWHAPQLVVSNLHADLYDAQIQLRGDLNVATRRLHASIDSNLDAHRLAPLLTEGAQQWLLQYAWERPPHVYADATLILPAWTNRHPDWRAEVRPTLYLAGQFNAGHGGAWRELAVSAAQSHFSYSNLIWRLPDLTVTRPEGNLSANYEENDLTKDFRWRVQSTIDLKAVRPLLETNQLKHFDLVAFTEPPHLHAEIWGRLHAPELVGFNGTVAATNFTIRGESITGFQTAFQYTNRFLLLTNSQAQRGSRVATADSLGIDFPAQKIYLSNGFSTTEPEVVARAIGPRIAKTVDPYRFGNPPTAHVHGIIPLHNDADADLHFDLEGGPFHWLKFNLTTITGHVHWKGEHLALENFRASAYDGKAAGSASFDFSPEHRTDFQFNLALTNALLQFLMTDISTNKNHVEGRLSGSLVVNKANSVDWHSWQGGGNVDLKEGLLWEIPIFGIFSPVLNGIAPGLGNVPANAASGTFLIHNGVVQSDDLEIRSAAMRLAYRGSVDLQGQVNARVEAELLRDMWLFGPLVSTVLWPVTKIFEYKLTGSLAQPKTDQVYFIGKMFSIPFHPFRTLKELLPEDTSGPTRTNSPPQQSP